MWQCIPASIALQVLQLLRGLHLSCQVTSPAWSCSAQQHSKVSDMLPQVREESPYTTKFRQ